MHRQVQGSRADAAKRVIPYFCSIGGEDMETQLAFIIAYALEHTIRLTCRVPERSATEWRVLSR